MATSHSQRISAQIPARNIFARFAAGQKPCRILRCVTLVSPALRELKHAGAGTFHQKEFQFISENTCHDLQCTEVKAGDVLISRMADPIGRACIVPPLPFRTVTAVDVTIIRVDENVVIPLDSTIGR